MADIRSFIIGRIIAENNLVGEENEEEENRIALVAALMPSPLLGAVVATALTKPPRDEEDGEGDGAAV